MQVDGMPVVKSGGQSPPLPAMLGHMENGVESLQIGNSDVATLHRQHWGSASVRSLCNRHAVMMTAKHT